MVLKHSSIADKSLALLPMISYTKFVIKAMGLTDSRLLISFLGKAFAHIRKALIMMPRIQWKIAMYSKWWDVNALGIIATYDECFDSMLYSLTLL